MKCVYGFAHQAGRGVSVEESRHISRVPEELRNRDDIDPGLEELAREIVTQRMGAERDPGLLLDRLRESPEEGIAGPAWDIEDIGTLPGPPGQDRSSLCV